MIIANPIYDSVFKFLLEDLQVAKRFLSVLIGEEILEIEFKPQENTTFSRKFLITVYRLDFKAIIRTKEGGTKKILIELQKGKQLVDVMRFRRYLGDNYSKPDILEDSGGSLPIITIYFLGFNLSIEHAVIKVDRVYTDVASGEVIKEKDDFIERLTHDCYIIQILRLPKDSQNKVEKILSVFNQNWGKRLAGRMINYMGDQEDDDLKLILKRLSLAAESEDVQDEIAAEEEFDLSIDSLIRNKDSIILQKESLLDEKDKTIEEMDKAIEEMDKTIERKEREIEDKERVIEDKEREIEKLKKLLQDKG